MSANGAQDVTVLRQNDTVHVLLPQDFAQLVLAAGEQDLMAPRFPFVVDQVAEGGAATGLLLPGDSLVSVNGTATTAFYDVSKALEGHASDSVHLELYRQGVLTNVSVLLDANGKLGVYTKNPYTFLKTKKIEYGFFEAIPAGVELGWNTLVSYVKQFKLVFTKEGAKSIGGFGAIGNLFPSMWDWQTFWMMTAMISIILAFMNILPIPALDGGYVMFLLYEMITGHKPGDKFLERANTIGLFILLALVLYANLNDIFKALF